MSNLEKQQDAPDTTTKMKNRSNFLALKKID
jgi:hypothetical protein